MKYVMNLLRLRMRMITEMNGMPGLTLYSHVPKK